jgi:hypothetical protein
MAVSDDEMLAGIVQRMDDVNADVETFLKQLLDSAQLESPSPVSSEPKEASKGRDLGDPKVQIKPVLYVEEVRVFEEALRATGIRNRGKALIEVCRAYIKNVGPKEEGQFDLPEKSPIA